MIQRNDTPRNDPRESFVSMHEGGQLVLVPTWIPHTSSGVREHRAQGLHCCAQAKRRRLDTGTAHLEYNITNNECEISEPGDGNHLATRLLQLEHELLNIKKALHADTPGATNTLQQADPVHKTDPGEGKQSDHAVHTRSEEQRQADPRGVHHETQEDHRNE